MTLTDRVAIVTGAGNGIGRATALALAQAGAHVVAVDVDAGAAKGAADAVAALGVGIASAQNLFDAEAVIIGGGLGDRLGAPFAERVKAAMMPHLFSAQNAPALLNTELGDLAGATGAALVAGA